MKISVSRSLGLQVANTISIAITVFITLMSLIWLQMEKNQSVALCSRKETNTKSQVTALHYTSINNVVNQKKRFSESGEGVQSVGDYRLA